MLKKSTSRICSYNLKDGIIRRHYVERLSAFYGTCHQRIQLSRWTTYMDDGAEGEMNGRQVCIFII